MKNHSRVASGITIVVLGALLALGPQFIFKICSQETATNSFWTARALLGIGGVIVLLGAAMVFVADAQLLIGLSFATFLNGVLAFLIPNLLIGMNTDPNSTCRTTTLPALNIVSILLIIVSGVVGASLLVSAQPFSRRTSTGAVVPR